VNTLRLWKSSFSLLGVLSPGKKAPISTMPPLLRTLLRAADRRFNANPPATQSSQRTALYQDALQNHLVNQGFNANSFSQDFRIQDVFDKKVDLVYAPFSTPRLAVSFKIVPLHEMSAHARSRLEEATGDAANMHMQYPDLVLGYFLVSAVDGGHQ